MDRIPNTVSNAGGGDKTVKQIFGIKGKHRHKKESEDFFGINRSIYRNLTKT